MQVAAVILIWHNWPQNIIVIIAGILCGMDASTYKEGYDILLEIFNMSALE